MYLFFLTDLKNIFDYLYIYLSNQYCNNKLGYVNYYNFFEILIKKYLKTKKDWLFLNLEPRFKWQAER